MPEIEEPEFKDDLEDEEAAFDAQEHKSKKVTMLMFFCLLPVQVH